MSTFERVPEQRERVKAASRTMYVLTLEELFTSHGGTWVSELGQGSLMSKHPPRTARHALSQLSEEGMSERGMPAQKIFSPFLFRLSS